MSWLVDSTPAQPFTTNLAPAATALSLAIPRSVSELLLASTSSSLQFGHSAEITSSCIASLCDQDALAVGSGRVLPCSLTIRRQPLAVVQAGSLKCLR